MSRDRAAAPPVWVRTEAALLAMAGHLGGASAVALDTESDSLHHFPEKVCLLQAAHPDGTVYLVDPLAFCDLAPLGMVLADPAVRKVLHGASYDVASLKRDFGFVFRGIFDTMLAAQLLGLPDLGLSGLLARTFGIVAGPSRQKDDWARRPLSAEQERYAAADVEHLIPLQEHLWAAIRLAGRQAWLTEECAALEEIPASSRVFDPEGYLTLKGAKVLDGRGLAVLRALFLAREEWAHTFGRPPFRLLGNDAMLAVARERPAAPADLLGLPGCTPKVVDRLGPRILEAVQRGLGAAEIEPSAFPRYERPHVPPAMRRRIEALTAWRAAAAERLQLDPGVLLPRRLIERLAETAPGGLPELEAIEGMRRWRIAALGPELLAVLDGRGGGRSGPRTAGGGNTP